MQIIKAEFAKREPDYLELNRLPRCLLLVPSIELSRYPYSLDEMDVDGLIFDLTGTAPEGAKSAARNRLYNYLSRRRPQFSNTYIRVNNVTSPDWEEDLRLVLDAKPDALMISDLSSAEVLREVEEAILKYEQASGRRLGLFLEMSTLESFRNMEAIFRSSSKIFLLSPGYEKLANELGILCPDIRKPGPINKLLIDLILTTKFYKLPVVDLVSRSMAEGPLAVMRAATRYGREVGMIGRVATHPRQVDIINEEYIQKEHVQGQLSRSLR